MLLVKLKTGNAARTEAPRRGQEKIMHILVSNDDGYRAPGVLSLVKTLQKEHKVTMVAPKEEQSGVGHGFTFLSPLNSKRVDAELGLEGVKAYAVSGTPVDCVKLGCYHFDKEDFPDMVVSGINRGANLGTDVFYSGTVSAAMEGAFMGLPAIAVSSCAAEPVYYDCAGQYVLQVIEYLKEHPLPTKMLLNLNVPDLPFTETHGIKMSRLAYRNYDNAYDPRKDPLGRSYFWLKDMLVPADVPGTDEYLVGRGYASLTPLYPDITAHSYLAQMESEHAFGGSEKDEETRQ